jgi:tyrosine-protein phosphatase SIW14
MSIAPRDSCVQWQLWMMRTACQTVTIVISLTAMLGVSFGQYSPALPLRNFQKVDDTLYRGAQPTAQGFRLLAQMGIHSILDLRAEGGRSTLEGKLVRSLGMKYINLPLAGYQAPTAKQIADVLAVLQDANLAPVFVHCRRGADRTGTMIALYRIAHDRWSNQKALNEAKGMRMAARERLMENLILQYKPSR